MDTRLHPLKIAVSLLLTVWFSTSQAAWAQQSAPAAPAPGMWFTLTSDARLSSRLGLHADMHWRGAQLASRTPAQNLMRAGLNVYLGKQAMATVGYAQAYALRSETPLADRRLAMQEQRLFQQFQFGESTGALWTRHRYRLEERWVRNAPADARTAYTTRLRYQLRLLLPLRRDHQLVPGTAYLVGANEVFLNLGSAPSFFDQNRASLLLGVQLSPTAALEAGLVNQAFSTGSSLDGGAGNVLQVGFAFSPDIRHGKAMRGEE